MYDTTIYLYTNYFVICRNCNLYFVFSFSPEQKMGDNYINEHVYRCRDEQIKKRPFNNNSDTFLSDNEFVRKRKHYLESLYNF